MFVGTVERVCGNTWSHAEAVRVFVLIQKGLMERCASSRTAFAQSISANSHSASTGVPATRPRVLAFAETSPAAAGEAGLALRRLGPGRRKAMIAT